MFQDEISQLVAETFNNLNKFSEPSEETENFEFSFNDIGEEDIPEEVPGFFYHLQLQGQTFVIRILESENLQADYESILNNPENYPSLRLLDNSSDQSVSERLQYFYCDNIYMAKAVKSYLSNRRYPIHEENIFNVSDPSDSWWIKEDSSSFTIYFKLSKTEQIDSLKKIGPLGDKQMATTRLGQFFGYFNQMFPVGDFSCNHGSFSVSTKDTSNSNFQDLLKLFSSGDANHDFWVFLGQMEMDAKSEKVKQSIRIANYYLMELSVVRKFWIEIQEQLST